MEESSANITVYIPSDLEPLPARAASSLFPCLDKLIARGDAVHIPQRDDAHLLTLFGGEPAGGTARAAVSHCVQQACSGDEPWRIIASPVHLVADHATLHFPPQPDSLLNDQESRSLLASCQDHFAEEGWQLEYGDANTWYLTVSASTRITTTPIDAAIGKPLFDTLPQGEDAHVWRRWSNEAQMLLHSHAVNDARQQQGKPLINTLWFWGGGRLPKVMPGRFDQVVGGDDYVQGLAKLGGTEWAPLPDDFAALVASSRKGQTLVVLTAGAYSSWEREWFCPLRDSLRTRALTNATLHFRNGHVTQLTPSMLWRLWRRSRHSLSVAESLA